MPRRAGGQPARRSAGKALTATKSELPSTPTTSEEAPLSLSGLGTSSLDDHTLDHLMLNGVLPATDGEGSTMGHIGLSIDPVRPAGKQAKDSHVPEEQASIVGIMVEEGAAAAAAVAAAPKEEPSAEKGVALRRAAAVFGLLAGGAGAAVAGIALLRPWPGG